MNPSHFKPPNVVFFLADDMGYGEVGVNGHPILETPAIDSLAKEGASFEYFNVSPSCAPTRAALLTGRHPPRTGVSGVTRARESMNRDEIAFAQLFREAGYATGIFGKWHNGSHFPHDPNAKGFEEFWGSPEGIWFDYFDPLMYHNHEVVETEGFITDVLTNRAMDFIASSVESGRPFLCYIPYNAPHTPALAPDEFYNRFREEFELGEGASAIYGMIENMDFNVGRVLGQLEELGIADNTMVIFLTDHGPDAWRINAGLKGRKSSYFEGGIRVPCFIRWPSAIPAGKRIERYGIHIDWLPTFMELCGLSHPNPCSLDGRSLAPLLLEPDPEWSDRISYIFGQNLDKDGPDFTPGTVLTQRWRAVKDHSGEPWELYDVLDDPRQQRNVAETYPWVINLLRESYIGKLEEMYLGCPLGQPLIPVGYDGFSRSILHGHEANLSVPTGEGIGYSYARGYAKHWIHRWTDEEAYAFWRVDVWTVGEYRATLYYTIEAENVGVRAKLEGTADNLEFEVNEAFDPPLNSVSFRVTREAGKYADKQWKALELGNIRLEKGEQEIALRLLSMPGEKAFDFKRLELNCVVTERD